MRVVCVLSLVLLTAYVVMGQMASSKHSRDEPPSGKSLGILLDRISALPPEYKADLAFTIVDTGPAALSPVRMRALLDDVFHSAARAHYRYQSADAAHHEDSLSHHTQNILGFLKSDGMDIQTGAIERALPSMPQLARRLFEK